MAQDQVDKKTIEFLDSIGIKFYVEPEVQGCVQSITLSKHELIRYVENPIDYVASYFGISVDEYFVANDEFQADDRFE